MARAASWIASTIAAAVACGSHSLAVGDEVDRAIDADRHHVAQLLLGLGRARA